ncbi:MAG: S26 family signal peptidase [Bacteroidia bacterium]|nr:S26 family signal peptidase [Bacteroidia bacterium]
MGNIIFLILVLISFVGLYKIFEKAGLPGWKALIPIYNFWVLGTIINRPKWWGLIMIVPGVNLIMYGVYGFHLARAFKKRMNNDLIMASFMPYLYFAYLGFNKGIKFFGVTDIKSESSFIKNWADPIIFAVVAASIIRGFFFEAFTIPTSSLEKSLMVGDFLFVNKVCYGAKVPQTPIAFPFAHHTLPFTTGTQSYLEWIKLPYMRLPGYSKPKNGEIIVFNYPDGDTVTIGTQQYTSYYEMVRQYGYQNMNNPNFTVELGGMSVKNGKKVGRPIDKREHYVKRCVGIAGDKLEIKDGELFINDKKQNMPEHAQHFYEVKIATRLLNIDEFFLDKHDIYVTEAGIKENIGEDTTVYLFNMPANVAEDIKNTPNVISVKKRIDPKGEYSQSIFPHNRRYPWNNDNFGPMTLPSEGMTIKIDTGNICLYEKMLSTYDDGIHQLTTSGAQVLYDGKPITSYTFKQGYYWMMGDNRHNSADSRSWGVVPFDHIVGRPVFVWLSIKDPKNNPVSGKSILGSLTKNSKEGKFRWDRFMCYVGENGLVSWKIPVAILVLLIFGYNFIDKRRKKYSFADYFRLIIFGKSSKK